MSLTLPARQPVLMLSFSLTAAFILGGCVEGRYRERRRVIVEEPEPTVVEEAPIVVDEPPPVVVQEYYFSGGRYYYWHPTYNRYVIINRVPQGRRIVRVERLPQRTVQRGRVNVPPPEHRHREHDRD